MWPKTSANGPPRTREEILEIIEKIDNGQEMTIDEAKGIQGRSVLFDIPYFDFTYDVNVDYLHTLCLGVVKRSVELTFKVSSDSRRRVTKRPLSSPHSFNRQISLVKVVREFNRRVRELDFAVYKGQEFRNILLFFFPLVLNCIEEGEKERDMWLYLTYMIKSCVIPTEEYEHTDLDVLRDCMEKFYDLYERLFGPHNCTYNTHVIGSHLIEMLHHGPFTMTSAFPFESFYGEMRHSFVPGTTSPLKQILSNVLIKRAISNHCCKLPIYISEKDTSMECNSLIYCFENGQFVLYKVVGKDDQNLLCRKIETMPSHFAETPHLNWSVIGVFNQGEISQAETIIHMSAVKGKLIAVNDLLITCPLNVLREK